MYTWQPECKSPECLNKHFEEAIDGRLQNGYTESENIPFPWDSRYQKSPWSTAVKTEEFCGIVMSAVLNENHNTSAHPLKQTHSATRQAESRPDTLQGAQHVRGKHIHWQMASSAVKCIGSVLDVKIPSNTYVSQSLSATLRIQYVL